MNSSSVPLRSLPSSSSTPLFQRPSNAPSRVRSTVRSPVACASERRSSSSAIPKLEPFSRSMIDRQMEEPSLIQKSENQLTGYCSILEGDESYSCWQAYFELKDLEKEMPREEIEKLIRAAGGVKTMIGYLHGITAMQKKGNNSFKTEQAEQPVSPLALQDEEERAHHIPDGLPPSQQELEEEENCQMPDSVFTRLLRSKGTHPAWYSEAPDHEYD